MNIIKKSANKITQNRYSNYMEATDASFAFTIMYNLFNLTLPGLITTVGAAGIYKLIKTFIIKSEKYSKDYTDIRKQYDLCVSNIANLFKELKIDDNPIKINYLLGLITNSGYLSKDYSFENSINNVYNFYDQGVMGAQVMTGRAYNYNVVRLFRDILNKLNINSDIVVTTKFNQRYSWETEITTELIDKLGLKDEKIELTDRVIDKIYNIIKPKIILELSIPDKNEQKYGNNDLIGLYYNNQYILLDPSTSSCYYNYKSVDDYSMFNESIKRIKDIYKNEKFFDDNLLLLDEYDNFAYIKNIEKIFEDDFGVLDERFSNVNEEFISKINNISSYNDNNKDIKEKTTELYKKNIMIFKNFYQDNKKIFNDINLKMSKIKALRR